VNAGECHHCVLDESTCLRYAAGVNPLAAPAAAAQQQAPREAQPAAANGAADGDGPSAAAAASGRKRPAPASAPAAAAAAAPPAKRPAAVPAAATAAMAADAAAAQAASDAAPTVGAARAAVQHEPALNVKQLQVHNSFITGRVSAIFRAAVVGPGFWSADVFLYLGVVPSCRAILLYTSAAGFSGYDDLLRVRLSLTRCRSVLQNGSSSPAARQRSGNATAGAPGADARVADARAADAEAELSAAGDVGEWVGVDGGGANGDGDGAGSAAASVPPAWGTTARPRAHMDSTLGLGLRTVPMSHLSSHDVQRL